MIETKTSMEIRKIVCDCKSDKSCKDFNNVRWVKVEDVENLLMKEMSQYKKFNLNPLLSRLLNEFSQLK